MDKNDYIEFINLLSFEINEMYNMGKITLEFRDQWRNNVGKLVQKYPHLTRTIIAEMGPVITLLGDKFHYNIDNVHEVVVYINDKLILDK